MTYLLIQTTKFQEINTKSILFLKIIYSHHLSIIKTLEINWFNCYFIINELIIVSILLLLLLLLLLLYLYFILISELLISSEADVNIRGSNGFTALHYSSMNGHLGIVQLLLCQGADISFRDNVGRTALDVASSYGRLEFADCLRKWPWTMAIIALQEIGMYNI